MFIKPVYDLFLEQLSLKHIFYCEFFRIFDFCYDLLQFLWLEDGIRFDDGDGEGKIDLFGIEKGLVHGSYI